MTLTKLHKITSELMKTWHPETKILLSSDEEGNRIRDLTSYSRSWAYGPESYGYDLIAEEDTEEYLSDEVEQVIVLWP